VKRVPLAFVPAFAVAGAFSSQAAPAVERVSVSIDEFEWKLLEHVNAMRARHGLDAVRLSPELASAAHHHSRDMARNGFCGHDSANGTSFWSRVLRFYGRGTGWRSWSAAENVLCHPRRVSAAAALARWLASPGHRANLLAPEWRDIGLAAAWAPSDPGSLRRRAVFLLSADFGARR
jgi:uncharacterized protein YkwD